MEKNSDPFVQFKAVQREAWSHFIPLEIFTTPPAAALVRFAGIKPGESVLDVGCGTGVVAVTATREGARVSGLDLSPVLLERARENAALSRVEVEFREGDCEALPYGDASFDVVLSQFGHMFAPRPNTAVAEMLRVLKPGGRIAFSTWPPELFTGRMFALVGQYLPAPEGVAPPPQRGDPNLVRERLGAAVTDLTFDRGTMYIPALSVPHYRDRIEATAGPVIKLVEALSKSEPERLARFRKDLEALIDTYLSENQVRQQFLMTRARKRG
jgi:SAM-dependent methyltransferase